MNKFKKSYELFQIDKEYRIGLAITVKENNQPVWVEDNTFSNILVPHIEEMIDDGNTEC